MEPFKVASPWQGITMEQANATTLGSCTAGEEVAAKRILRALTTRSVSRSHHVSRGSCALLDVSLNAEGTGLCKFGFSGFRLSALTNNCGTIDVQVSHGM